MLPARYFAQFKRIINHRVTMAVFAVITSNEPEKLGALIPAKLAPQDFHKVDDRTWFVNAPGTIVTPKELSDFLGVSQGGCRAYSPPEGSTLRPRVRNGGKSS